SIIFKRELTLLHVYNKKNPKLFFNYSKENAEIIISGIISKIKEVNKNIKITGIVRAGKLSEVVNIVAKDINAIMVVIGIPLQAEGQIRKAGRAIKIMRDSRIPYLMVQEKFPIENGYKNVVLPLDASREYKEKVLWASYFNRLYNSKIHILIPKSKDAELQYKINANERFTDKVFDDFEVERVKYNVEGSVYDIDKISIDYAYKIKAQLVIIMNTAFYSLFDYIAGPPEKTLIVNKFQIPVLCINPRDDLYVMCV
ncbi:MAG TPA: hypothetical protein P5250_03475, partial [Bacteroidales bacterium]|nr:hypothetical protein [Bacteroidales bacterium]